MIRSLPTTFGKPSATTAYLARFDHPPISTMDKVSCQSGAISFHTPNPHIGLGATFLPYLVSFSVAPSVFDSCRTSTNRYQRHRISCTI